jgi:hypothetical protein
LLQALECAAAPSVASLLLPRPLEGELPMLRLAALVFSTWVLLIGCTGPTYRCKAGSDVADFRRDSNACVQEPRMSWGASENPMIVGASTDDKRQSSTLYRMCMEARGWTAEAPQ